MNRIRKLAACLALVSLPTLALAHPGHSHDAGFVAGALHPFSGIDHLLGLALAGLLLGWLPAARRWPLCAAFLALLGGTHVLWMAPDAQGSAYLAGLMIMSASLLAAGMAASRLARRITAGAARSRI
jgi:urease accessory protein